MDEDEDAEREVSPGLWYLGRNAAGKPLWHVTAFADREDEARNRQRWLDGQRAQEDGRDG